MDPRRELSVINNAIRRRNREVGGRIVWYEFKPINTGASLYDDVYDEGAPGVGGRAYKAGVPLSTIYLEELEDSFRSIDEGRQPTQTVRATLLYKDLVSAGIENAREYQDHLNDVFEYDSRFYKIQDYKVRGQLSHEQPTGEVVVSVMGFEVYLDQEFPFSNGPKNPKLTTLPWPTSFPS